MGVRLRERAPLLNIDFYYLQLDPPWIPSHWRNLHPENHAALVWEWRGNAISNIRNPYLLHAILTFSRKAVFISHLYVSVELARIYIHNIFFKTN